VKDVPLIGQHGLRRHFYNLTKEADVKNYLTLKPANGKKLYSEKLAMHFEAPTTEGDYIVNVFKGWFVPPKTTKYRFLSSCDDYCSVKIGKTEKQTDSLTTLMDTHRYNEFRWYRQGD